ncbi:hypothetical protein FM106_09320 [Brachybacterium faecium]|nr:hypothetical protein FM106_09320 [Brachybacterium faecium]
MTAASSRARTTPARTLNSPAPGSPAHLAACPGAFFEDPSCDP